jgi:hypothetical protein
LLKKRAAGCLAFSLVFLLAVACSPQMTVKDSTPGPPAQPPLKTPLPAIAATPAPPAIVVTPAPASQAQNEARDKELDAVHTAVMAMLTESSTGFLSEGTGVPTDNMRLVRAMKGSQTLFLSDYLASPTTLTKYEFNKDGTFIQYRGGGYAVPP